MHPLFIKYCAYFNGNQDYFECHEVLEELWKELSGNKQHILVGFIQIAASLYHWRRGNFRGAMKLMKNGMKILETGVDYIDMNQLHEDCCESLSLMERGEAFRGFKIVIVDDELREFVQQEIETLPESDSEFLKHKHMLRKR